MIAFLSETYNENEVSFTPLNFCGMSPEFADPKQAQMDEDLRVEFAKVFACPTCMGSRTPLGLEFRSEDSLAMVSEYSGAILEVTTGRKPNNVELISSCAWNAYASPIAIAVLEATAAKAIDGSLIISESTPHPLKQAIVEFSRMRSVANGYVRERRLEKREAERRAKEALMNR